MLEAVTQKGSELGADDEQPVGPGDGCRTLADREVALEAVQQDGVALQHAASEHKANRVNVL